MKIIANSNGNYSPAYVKSTQNLRGASSAQKETGSISSDEKNFFAKLYPAQKEEVLNYQFYNAKGKVTGTHLGSLFDRRG